MGKRQFYAALHSGELVGTQRKRPQGTWRIHRDNLDTWSRSEVAHARRRSVEAWPDASCGVNHGDVDGLIG